MKGFVILILLLVIITIKTTCSQTDKNMCTTNINSDCYDDNDCCSSQYCSTFLLLLNGKCKMKDKHIMTIESLMTKGVCEYHKTNINKTTHLNNEFGYLNAAHDSLPPYIQIRVIHGKRSIIVTINDFLPKTNGTLLDLSYNAARLLNIHHEGFVHCEIKILKSISVKSIIKTMFFFLPVVIIIVFMFL